MYSSIDDKLIRILKHLKGTFYLLPSTLVRTAADHVTLSLSTEDCTVSWTKNRRSRELTKILLLLIGQHFG